MQTINFGGSQIARPGGYSVVNLKSNTPYTPGSSKVLAVIGSGAAGQPGVPLYFNGPQFASQRIGGTDAYTAAEVAWAQGADLVCFALTDVATQGTYALKSTDATPVTLVTYGGLRWNTADNSLQVTTTAPANGAQTVTITDTSVTPNVTEVYNLVNTAAGIASHINQVNKQSNLVQATAGPGGSTTNVAATVTTAASFTGGTRTAPTTTSITAAINALQTEDIQGIITTATDSTTQSAILNHCNTMSSVTNKRERRAFFGQAIGTTITQYKTAMVGFNGASRATLVANGIYWNVNGQSTLLSSAFHAAAIAGTWAGRQTPSDPITFKYLQGINGLEFNYLPSDIETLTEAQIVTTEKVPRRGYRIVRGMTADNTGSSLAELSVADLADVISRTTREIMEDQFAGKGSYTGIVGDMYQKLQSTLESYKKKQWIVDGVDQNGNPTTAYANINITQNGTAYAYTYDFATSLPVNFITGTGNLTV